MTSKTRPATAAVRAALESDQQYGAVVPPLHLSSNFTFSGYAERRDYDYTRSGNPTRDALADALAVLEGGAGATVTASGMGAIMLVLQLLKTGDCIVAPHDCYGGTHRLLSALSERGHVDVQFVDLTSTTVADDLRSLRPTLVLVESPSNPLLRITDIELVAASCKSVGALLAVDNTFLSPALQQPIALGADLVIHSTTKYLNGHSDVVGGAVVAATRELAEQVNWWANCIGITGAPFDSFLTLRGVRTLHARIRLHQENAQAVAELLQSHPAVDRVHYPGLTEHPDFELACKQQSGFGGMLSFELARGDDAVRDFLGNLRHFSLAESLGGVESLVCHPATMTHGSMPPESRETAGISDALIRLSVGIEDVSDLLADLRRALNIALSVNSVRIAAC